MTGSKHWHEPSPIVSAAIAALHRGGVIAYPTEAVFGLGCDPRSASALQQIIDIKGRDAHKGFILIASQPAQLVDYLAPINAAQQRQLDRHWPGPVTFVITASDAVRGELLCGFRDTLAVRVSSHPLVVTLCEQYGGAIVSTSANRSGEPALRNAADVVKAFGDRVDVVVDGPVGELDSPTAIFDLTTGQQLR